MKDPNRVDEARRQLSQLKDRLVKSEISEEEFLRRKALVVADLEADERAELGLPTPHRLGPSGGAGGAVESLIVSLSDIDLKPGTVLLGQFRIVKELGRGGFGAAFEAEDLHLKTRLAVKVLDPQMVAREDLLERFRREVKVMRELVHPRIVRVYDYRQDSEQELALISMELVSGSSVGELIVEAKAKGRPVPIPLALAILGQALEALVEAHRQRVIHRDVTPGNLLLAGGTSEQLLADPDCDPQVKLLDFGLAGLIERSTLSQLGGVRGTAPYMAPELWSPTVEATTAADVFGAGAVAYELLTGGLALGHFREPSEVRAGIAPALNALVLSLLSTEPGSRPPAEEAVRKLANLRGEARQVRTRQPQGVEPERRLELVRPRADEDPGTALAVEPVRPVGRGRSEAQQPRREHGDHHEKQEARRPAILAGEGKKVANTPAAKLGPKRLLMALGGLGLALLVGSLLVSQEQARREADRQRVAAQQEQQRVAAGAEQELRTERETNPQRLAAEQRLRKEAEDRAGRQQTRNVAPTARATAIETSGPAPIFAAGPPPEGTWRDPRTGLLWSAQDNGRDISWDGAKAYCDDLTLGGFADWQMASVSELEGLYDSSSSSRFRTRGSVELTSNFVWSAELKAADASSAEGFFFIVGGKRDWLRRGVASGNRALCVSREAEHVRQVPPARAQEVAPPSAGGISPAGTWLDERTGLMWASRDKGRDTVWDDAKTYCEGSRLGGFSDWRMPSIEELEGLYDASSSKTYKTRGSVVLSGWVWSGSLNEDDPSTAWRFNFIAGTRLADDRDKIEHHRALCVRQEVERAEQSTRTRNVTPPGDPEVSTAVLPAAGTWRDARTGLLWTGKDNGTGVSWAYAKRYCENLTLGGSGGWRMPSIEELEKFYDGKQSLTQRGVVTLSGWWVWSRDLKPHDSSAAWYFSFGSGERVAGQRGSAALGRALCVRRTED